MLSKQFCALLGIYRIIAALLMGLGLSLPSHALPFTLNPSNVGINGPSFTADALKATEASHIVFDSVNTNLWTEHGYAQITGAVSNGLVFTPTGLNNTYSLYFEFGGTGDQSTNLFNTAYMRFFAVNGQATFSIEAVTHNALVDTHGNTPVLLSNSDLLWGTTGQKFIAPGNPPKIDFFASLMTTFSPTLTGLPFFNLPPNTNNLFGDFYHEASGVSLLQGEVVLVGGDDTLVFLSEPDSLILFAFGLSGLFFANRLGKKT